MRFLIACLLCLSFLSLCNGAATVQVIYYSDTSCVTQIYPNVQVYPAVSIHQAGISGTYGGSISGIGAACLTSNIPTGFIAVTAACGTDADLYYAANVENFSSSSTCTTGNPPTAMFSTNGANGGCGTLTYGSVPVGSNVQSVKVVCNSATGTRVPCFALFLVLIISLFLRER